MGSLDSESADNSSIKKHQETLCILTSCYHGTTYAYVLRWFYRIHGKSRKNLEWFPCKGDAKSATWTKSFRLEGAYFWKNKPRSPILLGFGEDIYALLSFTGQQYLQNEPMADSVDESNFITDLSEAISEVSSMPTPSSGVDVDELRFQKKLRSRANRKRRI